MTSSPRPTTSRHRSDADDSPELPAYGERTLPTAAPETPEPTRSAPLGLSATGLLGGALAAMTAAVIGARLGVAGTVLGAALGSLVAGVAGSLYTASLKHTRTKLTSVWSGRVGGTEIRAVRVPEGSAPAPTWDTAEQQPAASLAPVSADPVAATAVTPAGPAAPGAEPEPLPTRGRLPWKGVLVSTVAVFGIAAAGITGFELATGQAVSGGEGTTITRVSENRSGGSDTTPTQAPSAEPSDEPSTGGSTTPSAGPTEEPSAAPSDEPTTDPSPTTEPSPTGEPSTSTEPTTEPSAPGDSDGQGAQAGENGGVAGG